MKKAITTTNLISGALLFAAAGGFRGVLTYVTVNQSRSGENLMSNRNQRARLPFFLNRYFRMVIVSVMALALAGCGSEPPEGEYSQASEQGAATLPGDDAMDSPVRPDSLPSQIPLPDDYIVIATRSSVTDTYGRDTTLVFALPGSVDEWVKVYEEVLNAEFENVERQMDMFGHPWTFAIPEFEDVNLFVTRNHGHFDGGSVPDTSEYPVLLTLTMVENAR